ncbi:SMC family ATPase [Synechococcus sp. PCC 6312]|uniref:AAA family ATPase n=1 Tax=Synechococcus sp. (strain ATCC 27167 / PCC 6312) TaxID=195253 RepID=UPI00029F2605|nr:SMC family ATPase [Synechococcus sp. PCC 6312]AFY62327.1 ATPase involved in DNA repair [Synechococcus sp. PCC 6312]
MEITSVVLKNFKIHQDQRFEFRPGINAICGENGAGKTSIIEAVAWVLFDYSSYNKADLIRNGTKSAQAWVNFISSYDERPYRIQRCTTKGYEIYDPQLQQNLGLKNREDIARWLRQQLGITGDLALSNLFSEMIGIPQGTFTADFLKNPEGRKKVFDPILRVDDYKNAYQKALDLEKYSQAQLQRSQQQLALYEQQLADWDSLKQQAQALQEITTAQEQQLTQLTQHRQSLESQAQQLQTQATRLRTLTQDYQYLQLELANIQTQLQQQNGQVTAAEAAQHLCKKHLPAYQACLELSATLQTLEQQLQDRPQLEQQAHQIQAQQQQATIQLSQLELQLSQLTAAQTQIAVLEPLLPQQQTLEANLQAIQLELTTLQQAEADYQELSATQAKIQNTLATLDQEITALEALRVIVTRLPELEAHSQQLNQHQQERKLSQTVLNQLTTLATFAQTQRVELEELNTTAQAYLQAWPDSLLGKSIVEQALSQGLSQFQDLDHQLQELTGGFRAQSDSASVEDALAQIQAQLHTARQAQLQLATLPGKQEQQCHYQAQLAALDNQLRKIQARLAQLPDLESQAQVLREELDGLGNPRAQIKHLQQSLGAKPQLEQAYEQQQAMIADFQDQSNKLATALNRLNQLEQQRQTYQQQYQLHQPGSQIYLQHLNLAQQVTVLQSQLEDIQSQQTQLSEKAAVLNQELTQAQATYDPTELDRITREINQAESQINQLLGSLPLQQTQLTQLQTELAARSAIYDRWQEQQTESDRQIQIDQFIQTSRQIFNQSGPRITQYYMSSIVQVADQLFRELLNRPDVALAWTEDYEIRVQEEGHWRGFKSLSGGEQMCGALAIRLALLKVLVEIDIAFFDEPTTNMDTQRRSQLATALGNLRSFHQLFVISHDDAFEQMTENIIRVSRSS